MAGQQTNKIIRGGRGKKVQGRGGIGQSTRDIFPLLSFFFFHLAYFCLFCLFLPFERFGFSCVVQRGGMGGRVAFQGVDLLLCVWVCVCPCLCNYIPQIPKEEGGLCYNWLDNASKFLIVLFWRLLWQNLQTSHAWTPPAALLTVWQNSNWYVLVLKGSFQSTNLVFFFLSLSLLLPGTQVFSCTFEPALLCLLVADQR